jgi:pyruvate dehydrogenase complex dehydrogenase (E1) component
MNATKLLQESNSHAKKAKSEIFASLQFAFIDALYMKYSYIIAQCEKAEKKIIFHIRWMCLLDHLYLTVSVLV